MLKMKALYSYKPTKSDGNMFFIRSADGYEKGWDRGVLNYGWDNYAKNVETSYIENTNHFNVIVSADKKIAELMTEKIQSFNN